VWHPVPSVFETSLEQAKAFARAWDAWVGGSVPLDAESPDGFGVLATHRGSDPFSVTTVSRDQWR
jgi:hypothetical protein